MQWRSSHSKWGWMIIILHWLSFVIIAGLVASGLWMVELDYYHSWYHKAPHLHKSTGVLLALLTLFRIFWRFMDVRPQSLSEYHILEQWLARNIHRLFYIIILATMFSGYLISTAQGQGVDVFGWFEIPPLYQGFEQQEELAGDVHFWLASFLVLLIFIHAAGAFKHHWLDKDETLMQMLGKSRS